MRLAIRVFVEGQLTSEQAISDSEEGIKALLPKLAGDHARQSAERPTLIEIEFLDEPDQQQRFFRIGTDPKGMVQPIRIEVGASQSHRNRGMNNTVRTACVEWISLALQKTRPEEQRPDEMAEQLFAIAEEYAVPAEAVVEWIHRQEPKPQITTKAFRYWAQAFDATRAMERKKESRE